MSTITSRSPNGMGSLTFAVAVLSLVHPEALSPDGEVKVICTRTRSAIGSVSTALSLRTHA